MSRGWRDICPVCGNYKQDGICLRCNANAATRARRWRRGDRGGVRPERRIYKRRRVDKKQSERAVPAAQRIRKKHFKTAVAPDGTCFYLALHGDWYSDQEEIKINIDLTKNRWVFTVASGKRLSQFWHLKYSSPIKLIFTRKHKEIIASIGKDGVLMLTGKSKPVPFVNMKSGKRYRICRMCFAKSKWEHEQCEQCGWSF
jgi:ribosomal protein L40E